MLRSVLGWLCHFTPKLHYAKNAPYSGVRVQMTEATTYKERHFLPVEMFLDPARKFVAKVKTDNPPLWPDLMAAASLLSLSLEALVNSLGPHLVNDFQDFDSASPVAKLRIIFEKLGLDFDKSRQPIADILDLARFRNKIAHPKYKKLTYTSERLPIRQAQRLLRDESKTLRDLEKSVSPEALDKWLKALLLVSRSLLKALDPELQRGHSRSWLEIHDE